MQVKTFTGKSTKEVLDAIKAELGSEAVILASNEIKKDGQRVYEITAGLDRKIEPEEKPVLWDNWHREWSLMKDHIYSLMHPSLPWDILSPHQRVAMEYLQREGVNSDVLVELFQKLAQFKQKSNASLLKALASFVPVKPFSIRNYPQKIHIFAGPYGAGKTSSALRMALLRREERPEASIAFINMDCLRGNGKLVLRHWTQLSDFIYHEASSADELQTALRACHGVDTIIIDLPGLPASKTLGEVMDIYKIKNLDAVVHLTISPIYGNMGELLKRYKNPFPTSLVWTKLDEAFYFSELINVAVKTSIPISALSFGPELQNSLIPAQEKQIWQLILKHQLPCLVDA